MKLLRQTNQEGLIEIKFKSHMIKINPYNLDVYTPFGNKAKWAINKDGYRVCKVGLNIQGKKVTYHILEHRLVVYLFGDKYGKTIDAIAFVGHGASVVDHIDSNRLNTDINNLQVVSKRYNSSREKSLKSGLPTGVVWHKRDKKYMAYIKIGKKTKFIGYYKTQEEASAAYQQKVKVLSKEHSNEEVF